MKEIHEFFSNLRSTFPTVTLTDILDILVVTVLIYYLICLIWKTGARRIAKGIVFLLVATAITDLLNLHTVNYLLDRVFQIGFVALVIVFQPELRRILERVGSKGYVRGLLGMSVSAVAAEQAGAINEVVEACEAMSRERVGALIVLERTISIDQIAATGTRMDAEVSQELIRNIFFPKAALHDGALIIRGGRIEAAGCVLPLSENRSMSTDLGTRHRAGVGISETCDALVVIVSEETGAVSVAEEGMLKRHLATQTLKKLLLQELMGEEKQANGMMNLIKRKGRRKGGDQG